MNKCFGSLLAIVTLFIAGCGRVAGAPAPENQCVCALLDGSISAVAERGRLLQELQHAVDALGPGDIFSADVITENPYATVRFPVLEVLPVMDPGKTTPLAHKKALAAGKMSILEQVEQILKSIPEKGQGAIKNTALLDAISVAARQLKTDFCQRAHRRVLLLFTDAIEDSARANFNTADLSAKGIQQLIRREKSDHHLPDLAGTDVWLVGATPDRRMAPERIRHIEAFWQAYFAATGARLGSQRYGARLLDFGTLQ